MGDSLSILFATIVAFMLMFLFPMVDTWERQDDLSYVTAYTSVVNLVDAVRNTGVITLDMYNDLLTTVNATGNRFDVKIEHRENVVVPDGPNSSTMLYEYHYTTQILNELKTHGYYPLKKGDFFYVSVKNTNTTQATVIKEKLYGTNLETFKIGVPYGGQVRNNYGG